MMVSHDVIDYDVAWPQVGRLGSAVCDVSRMITTFKDGSE